jgi:hypothetical protein
MRLLLILAATVAAMAYTTGAYAQRDPRDIMEWEDEIDRQEAQLTPAQQQSLREDKDRFNFWVLVIVLGVMAFFFLIARGGKKPEQH